MKETITVEKIEYDLLKSQNEKLKKQNRELQKQVSKADEMTAKALRLCFEMMMSIYEEKEGENVLHGTDTTVSTVDTKCN